MDCLFCGSDQNKVLDKRSVKSLREIRRRRECLKCHRRFTTYERICEVELCVIKRDGRKEPFEREKLLSGVQKAFEKRPDIDRAQVIVERIESKLREKGEKEISTKAIGRMVLSELRKVDKVAYLRFASVYRDFKELGDFTRELQGLN